MIRKPISILLLCTILFLGLNTCGGQFQRPFPTTNRGQSQFGGQSQFQQKSSGQFQSQFNTGQSQFQSKSTGQSQFLSNQIDQNRNVPLQKSQVSCPERTGRFPVASQCDAYIECIDGVGEEKLCPEGLLFNPNVRFNYPCGYPIDVQCLGRSNLQPAKPTEDCPHQYGYFKVGDQKNCGKFMNCADGVGYIFDCPEGLAYNSETYRCDWPDQVTDCDAEAYLGFSCPNARESGFLTGEIRFYRSPSDCQRYFTCVNGRPRLQNCGEGNAFNDLINACDAVENVTGCNTGFEKRVPNTFLQGNTQGFQQRGSNNQQLNNFQQFRTNQQTGGNNYQQSGLSSKSRFGRF
ncbi:protein obstructor-E-like [Leptopilina boulardi]|uniref:protein obstructor-E-like n=1 Tax=Leptopilina boulardi TaxID=63433 RepID=UPI0021F55051|nr:protein obstructor-E-like [Leptopilina boulardi]